MSGQDDNFVSSEKTGLVAWIATWPDSETKIKSKHIRGTPMDYRLPCKTSLQRLTIACLLLLILAGRSPAQQGALPDPNLASRPPAASDQEKFGLPPDDYSHEFLRQEAILLKPCEWQCDVGLNYTIFDHRYTGILLDNNDPVPVDYLVRRRLLVMPLQLRFGLTDRIQLFAAAPVGWTNAEVSSAQIGVDSSANDGGLGDTNFGFSWQLHKSEGYFYSPDIIATFGAGAPTCKSDLYAAIFGNPQTVLGQGVWAGSWNVLFVHTCDPVVVFYGFGGWHGFAKGFSGHIVRPGDQYSYRGGVGFAVNEHITLSSTLYGYYITEAWIDGQEARGTAQEPVYLRLAVTIAERKNRIVEPFAEIGMSDDAANARFGVTWTF
jgi:hypothetical protein